MFLLKSKIPRTLLRTENFRSCFHTRRFSPVLSSMKKIRQPMQLKSVKLVFRAIRSSAHSHTTLTRAFSTVHSENPTAFKYLASIPSRHPFAFGAIFTCAKTAFADLLVQVSFEKREQIDWKRNMVFTSFGLFYLGMFQYLIYVKLFSYWFPNAAAFSKLPTRQKLADKVGMMNTLKQVAFDQFFHIPFCYFPTFYLFKELVLGDETKDVLSRCTNVLTTYKGNFISDNMASCKVWIPCNIINFGFMPMHFRIPFMAFVSLFWTCILSIMRGSKQVKDPIKKVQELLPQDDEEIVRLTSVFEKYADDNRYLTKENFAQALQEMNVVDDGLIRSFFDCFDQDHANRISFDEFRSSLLIMHAKGSSHERVSFLFRACDIDGNGVLDKEEVYKVVRNMLASRENLISHTSSEESLDLLGGMQSLSLHEPSAQQLEKRQRARLQDLRQIYPQVHDATLQNILSFEASEMVATVFHEADTSHDNVISLDEFEAWLHTNTKTGRKMQRLFSLF